MSRSKDLSKILQGLKLISDQVLKNSNEHHVQLLQYRMNRIQYHVIELVKNLFEFRNDTFYNSDPKNSSVNDGDMQSNSYQSPRNDGQKNTKVEDLIGFPTVDANESLNDLELNAVKSENVMKARPVPSTPIARLWGFGSLAVRMSLGVATDSITRSLNGSPYNGISDSNAERLAEALCRMRGAALKLGQMLSLHDENVLPSSLSKALERVRQSADYMPINQLNDQMTSQFGENWRQSFAEFDDIPIAAASIGQVHRGKLLDGTEVAIKIQYPGVADSIESDLNNLKRIVTIANVLPPGLYIEQIMKVAKDELSEECDYIHEADCQIRYREFVLNDKILSKHVNVPEVYLKHSTRRILTTRLIKGISIEKTISLSQNIRNAIARTTLITTIHELFKWRLMQSDPNYSNFLYDNSTRTINMIDFGAAREYSKDFVDGYMKLVWAAANNDREGIIQVSKELGYLTGDESQEMLHAHVETGLVVGEPFLKSNPVFDFASSNLVVRLSQYGSTFMKHRLTPPPTEAYSLHRKLAGAFLLCIRLKAVIPCRDILEETYRSYEFTKK